MEEKPSKKFKVVTLGCRTNQYESQAYRDQLQAIGFSQAADDEEADLCIVNTCTVTESADSSSRHEIRRLVRENSKSRVVVTGCSVEQQPEAIRNIEGVSDLVSNRNKERLVEYLFPEESVPEFNIKQFEARTRAFIKVQDGCDSWCTYCILPYVRGRSRSRTIGEIVREAETLVGNGYKEIVLTGINIGDFDGNKPEGEPPDSLADLVRMVDRVPGLERLRVSSIDPDEVDDNLMDAIINGRTTCHSMHIVLQSGSNVILKRMNRKYTRQIFLKSIERLKEADPDFTFTTDVIVGFPGETEEDFGETLAVMREVKFAKVHMFPYSVRPRTRAALFPNRVSPEVMQQRKQIVMRLSEQIAFELRNQFLSRRLKVLVEGSEDKVTGHTSNFLPVMIQADSLVQNDLIEVELVENTPSSLIGRPCK